MDKGTVIDNTAFIYFDLNEAVVTNTLKNPSIVDLQLLPQGIYSLEIQDLHSGQKVIEKIIKVE